MTLKYIFLIFCIQFSVLTFAQSEIGLSGGFNQFGFYHLQGKYNYLSNQFVSKKQLNYVLAIHYKEPISNRLFAGFELENMQIKSKIYLLAPQNRFYSYSIDALVYMNYMNLHFLFGGKLFSIKKLDVLGAISPYYGYLLSVNGTGYDTEVQGGYYFDSLGVQYSYVSTVKRPIQGSKTFKKANVGLGLNIDVCIPLKDKLQLSVKPAYNLGIYNVIKEDRFCGLNGFSLTAGVVYKLDRKYLHFSEWEKYAKPATQK